MAPDVREELGDAEGLEEVASDAGGSKLFAGAGEDEGNARAFAEEVLEGFAKKGRTVRGCPGHADGWIEG